MEVRDRVRDRVRVGYGSGAASSGRSDVTWGALPINRVVKVFTPRHRSTVMVSRAVGGRSVSTILVCWAVIMGGTCCVEGRTNPITREQQAHSAHS